MKLVAETFLMKYLLHTVGLELPKQTLQEIVILPSINPEVVAFLSPPISYALYDIN
jgi:hypothetical protein